MNKKRVNHAYTKCSLFSSLDSSTLDLLVASSKVKSIPSSACIFDIGDPSEELYLLIKGYVSFQYYALNGKKVSLSIADKHMIIGDMELLDPTPRKSRAVAMTACEVAILPKLDFLSTSRENPIVFEKLLKIYSRRLQQATRIMLIKDDTSLLCSVLLNLSHRFGNTTPQGIEIQLSLSQEELASYIGIPRQRLNRMLGDFKNNGWIQTKYNTITLLDEKSMNEFLSRTA
jgi:CRP-like cAMP-binding protein